MLILRSVDNFANITYLLNSISAKKMVPPSTLKLNAKILKDLGLIEFNCSPARITPIGKFILEIVRGGTNE